MRTLPAAFTFVLPEYRFLITFYRALVHVGECENVTLDTPLKKYTNCLNSSENRSGCIGKRPRFRQLHVELRIQHSLRRPPLEGGYVLNKYHRRRLKIF